MAALAVPRTCIREPWSESILPVMNFAERIRSARVAAGLSQAKVAELVGRSPSALRNWERGKTVPSDRGIVVALAAVLDVAEDELLELAGFAPEDPAPAPPTLADLAPETEPPARPWETEEPIEPSVEMPVDVVAPSTSATVPPPLPPIAVPPPPSAPAPTSYLEDSREMMTYRIRALLTAAVGLLLLLLIEWGLRSVGTSLKELWTGVFG